MCTRGLVHTALMLLTPLIIEFQLTESCLANNAAAVQLWPDGVIPYTIPQTYNTAQKSRIRVAMDRWERKTCIRFVPWSSSIRRQFKGAVRYISFHKSDTCYSRVGMYRSQPQYLGLGDYCMKLGTIVHELGHTIGMIHTVARSDRDYYVNIMYSNINNNSMDNFQTIGNNYDTHGTPYDYKSVMHYGQKAWSINNKVVIKTHRPAYQHLIGQKSDVSFYDAVYVNRAYRCQARCIGRDVPICMNGGEVGGANCQCLCHDGFIGKYCETPLPGYQHIIDWRCQRGWNFRQGKCVKSFPNIIVRWSGAQYFCVQRQANMMEIRDEEDAKWFGDTLKEDVMLTTARSFWVGVRRDPGDSFYKWSDGTRFNDSLMPLHELGSSSNAGCGKSDGKSITVSTCDASNNNGIICIKDFESDCGGRVMVTSTPSSFISPGYPNQYSSKLMCQYILQARRGSRIEVKFTDFDIEYSARCRHDSLEIQLAADILQRGERYCGAQLRNRTFISEGHMMYVTFSTNENVHGLGFRAVVRTVNPPNPQNHDVSRHGLLDTLMNVADSSDDSAENRLEHASFLDSFWDVLRSMSVSNILN